MPRLSWRKQLDENGQAAIGQSPRGLEIRYGTERIGSVRPVTDKNRWDVVAWYFYAQSDAHKVPSINTCGQRHYKTKEEARAACDKYVREHFRVEGE